MHDERRQTTSPISFWTFASLVMWLLIPSISAAQYQRLPYGPAFLDANGSLNAREVILRKGPKNKVLSGSRPFDETARADLDTWYKEYQFRRLTMLDEESHLPKVRAEILKDLQMCRSEEVKTYLLQMIMGTMEAIAKGKYSPAARINAMHLIGELNSAPRSVSNPTPTPYYSALGPLRRAIIDDTQLDGVRLAAMVGMLRHVESQWAGGEGRPKFDGRAVAALLGDMTRIINKKDPDPGKNKRGNDWMRMRAVQILVALNTLGRDDEVFKTLYRVVADEDNEWYLRLAAVQGMGRLQLAQAQTITEPQYAATVKLTGAIAAKLFRDEAARLRMLEELVVERKAAFVGLEVAGGSFMGPTMGGMGGDMGGMDEERGGGDEEMGMDEEMGPGFGPMMGAPGMTKPRDVALYFQDTGRRRLHAQMRLLLRGLEGTTTERKGVGSMVTSDAEVKRVEDIKSAINALLTDTLESGMDLDAIVKRYEQAAASLEVAADVPPPNAVPAEKPPEGTAPVVPGAAPVVPGAAPVVPGAPPAVPGPAVPAVPGPAAPAVPGPAVPAVPGPAAPAVPGPAAPAVPAVPGPAAPAAPVP